MRTSLVVLIAFAGCKCGDSKSTSGIEASSPTLPGTTKAPATPPLASKDYFRVDAAPDQPACQVDAPCEAQLIVTALGDYHVNENYPFKLVVTSPDVKVDGTGTFTAKGKQGTMALPFRATAAGTAKLAGTFKLSVCNDENCQIESPKIAFDVPVRAAN